MRLWIRMSKRLALKRMGKDRFRKLNAGKHLKSGDLVFTCLGYNQVIESITPEWFDCRRGSFIWDFEIITDLGGSCSLVSCCTVPSVSQKEVIAYWEAMAASVDCDYICEICVKTTRAIIDALKNGVPGEKIFDQRGRLKVEGWS